jgi:hypothetical protein
VHLLFIIRAAFKANTFSLKALEVPRTFALKG